MTPQDLFERRALRFWSRVTKSDGCWTHAGSIGSHGYPQATHPISGQSVPASHVAVLLSGSPVSPTTFRCHGCNNRMCVRVGDGHIYIGTHKSNMDDMCRAGHPRRKLSAEQAREAFASNEPHQRIAARLGVTTRVIEYIKRRVTYRHDTLP